ncbi:DUF6414 family protein [Brevibacillus laterosporus]|uniref:DUF6414 family protein n=1 Tax=Brevibacillus laterosporus TaxID=1465 RepID=A0AAP3GD49_BRELA|nr:DUF6414 family protein [Brevibacillus laterosporus]MCR8982454.1 DUF6414 family protein [Brevibacillus laterosporus]MCZ0809610.1 DUF6414 family protein [Brevibacillus laterosporus]MCZ0828143.1 DUF6414 family protein [Brevibacillus laterosporus]MCZ0852165.1 DUF6414 family protein [Brevibacillus laterosporus]
MIKVIYFDEGSATDFLQIFYGGNIVIMDEQKGELGYKLKGKSDVTVGAGSNFFSFLKASFSINGNGELYKSKDSLLKTTLSNTILSDFVSFASDLEENSGDIKIFKGYKVRVIKNSLAFAKMYTPFIKMLKEGSDFSNGLDSFNYLEFDDILKGAKGYYELLATSNKESVIFRFNINAFRNSYSLAELTKMKLTYYGIEVGECREEDLLFENEFSRNENEETRASTEEMYKGQKNKDPNLLKIYDVILAGISGVEK